MLSIKGLEKYKVVQLARTPRIVSYYIWRLQEEWTGGPLRGMWQWDVDFGRISCAGGILLVWSQPDEKSTKLHPKISKPNV